MRKKLTLSKDRKICGVCGGFADLLEIDPTIIRIIYTLATLFSVFPGVLLYILLAFIIPDNKE